MNNKVESQKSPEDRPTGQAKVKSQKYSEEKILLKAESISKKYVVGGKDLWVLKGINLTIKKGEFVLLLGPSGAGKSTLLHLLATLESPTEGKIYWQGKDTSLFTDKEKARLRNREMGFIFQFFNLLPEFTAIENIILPGLIASGSSREVKERGGNLLEQMYLSRRSRHRPAQLSGGEQQRIAIARSLINEPQIVFADEPTGNLDKATGSKVLEILKSLNREKSKTLFVATHQEGMSSQADQVIRILDGRVKFA